MEPISQNEGPKKRQGFFSRFLADRKGVVAIMAIALLPVLFGIGGLGLDASLWYVSKQKAQSVSDAAAFAAALAIQAGNNTTSGYTTEATGLAGLNGFVTGTNGTTVTVHNPPSSGSYSSNSLAVEAIIQQNQTKFLSAIDAQLGNVTATGRSVALATQTVYCILATGTQSANAGVDFTGAGTINMSNCSIADNATGTNALSLSGFLFLQVQAYTALVAGGDSCCGFNLASPALDFTHAATYNATSPAVPVSDPYASRTMPAKSSPAVITALVTASASTSVGATTSTTAPAIPAVAGTDPASGCTFTLASGTTALTNGRCYNVTVGGTINVSAATGVTANICGFTLSSGTFAMTTTGTGVIRIWPPGSGGKCGTSGSSVTLSGGTFTVTGSANVQVDGMTATSGTLNLGNGAQIYSLALSGATVNFTSANATGGCSFNGSTWNTCIYGLTQSSGSLTLPSLSATSGVSVTAGNLSTTASAGYMVGLTINNSASTVTIANGYDVWTTSLVSGTLTGSAGTTNFFSTGTGNGLTMTGGTATFGSGNAVYAANVSAGTLTMSNSATSKLEGLTLSGTGLVALAGNVSAWTVTQSAGTFCAQATITSGACVIDTTGNTKIYTMTQSGGTATFYPGTEGWAVASNGGTFTFNKGTGTPSSCPFTINSVSTNYVGCLFGFTVGGGAATFQAGQYLLVGPSGSAGLSLSSGSVLFDGTGVASKSTVIYGPCAATGEPAVNVTGGTLNMNFTSNNNFNIMGGSGSAAFNVTGGTVNIAAGTTVMEGGSLGTACNTSGNGGEAIDLSGGTFTISNGSFTANTSVLVQSANASPAIAVSGGTMSIAGTANIQGGSGEPSVQVTGTGTFETADSSTMVIGGTNYNASQSSPQYGITVKTSSGACGFGNNCASEDLALGSGTYTIWGGIQVQGGNVTLNHDASSSGIYIMAGGQFTMSTAASGFSIGDLQTSDATIVLTTDGSYYAYMTTAGADGINMSAPSTGNTAGIIVFQDRNAPSPGTTSNTFYGINFDNMSGALYFPEQPLAFNGINIVSNNGSQPGTANSCLQLIGYTVAITGITFMSDQCTGVGVAVISANSRSAMVQ